MAAKTTNNLVWSGIGSNARTSWVSKRLNLRTRPDLDRRGSINPARSINIYQRCSGSPLNPADFEVNGRTSPSDILVRQPLKTYYELYCNVIDRMWHLAETLKVVYDIYHSNGPLYSDRLLAFVGNEIVREWSWTDFPFTSVAAQNIIGQVTPYNITGLYNFEITDPAVTQILSELHYEHWTPISFFRDVFPQIKGLTVQDFFEILICNYRVVRITHAENRILSQMQFGQVRPVNAYQLAGITVFEQTMWQGTF
jgi:hypothetical protein